MECESSGDTTLNDGSILHWFLWIPDSPRAIVFIVHGLGEHCGRFRAVASRFTDRRFGLMGVDLRGHGLTHGKRGHIVSITQILLDIQVIAKTHLPSNIPWFIWGHSMGGQIALQYGFHTHSSYPLSDGSVVYSDMLKGVAVTGPYLELAFKPPGWKVFFGKMLGRMVPSFTMTNELNNEDLTRIPEELKAYEDDKLVHEQISTKTFLCCTHGSEFCLKESQHFPLPVFFGHGTADKICSIEGSRKFFSAVSEDMKEKQMSVMKEYDGGFHEPHFDLCRDEFFEDLLNWVEFLLRRVDENEEEVNVTVEVKVEESL